MTLHRRPLAAGTMRQSAHWQLRPPPLPGSVCPAGLKSQESRPAPAPSIDYEKKIRWVGVFPLRPRFSPLPLVLLPTSYAATGRQAPSLHPSGCRSSCPAGAAAASR